MEIHFCKDIQTMVRLENFWVQNKLRQYEAGSIYLPAGQTPVPLYELWSRESQNWLKNIQLVQIDDVLDGPKQGLFRSFFESHLPNYLDQLQSPQDSDPVQADLAILGLGRNGHVAFHEPHLPKNFKFGEVQLARETAEHLGVAKETKAISYGLGSFMQCRAILLIVSGSGKIEVFEDFLKGLGQRPVNALKEHSDLTVIASNEFEDIYKKTAS